MDHGFTPILDQPTNPIGGPSSDAFGGFTSESTMSSSEVPMMSSIIDFNPSTSYTTDDFTSFLDSISLPTHPFSPTYQPLPSFSQDSLTPMSENHVQRPDMNLIQAHTMPQSELSRIGSRLPSLHPEEDPLDSPTISKSKPRCFSEVSSLCRDGLLHGLAEFSNVIPGRFVLPSRYALSRFIAGYVTGFHEHYPILHLPSLPIKSLSLELFLAIASLGARYCREPEKSIEIFRVSKAVALERIRRWDYGFVSGSLASAYVDSNSTTGYQFPDTIGLVPIPPTGIEQLHTVENTNRIQMTQTLLLQIAMATWFKNTPAAREALSLRSILDCFVRETGLELKRGPPEATSWESWIEIETVKRTQLVVFCFLNLHTVVFDISPMLLFTELDMDLPCTENEWKADSEMSWREARELCAPEPNFQDAIQSLFGRGSDTSMGGQPACFSSLGGYILIHAIIQHIWLLQQAARLPPRQENTLNSAEASSLERALRRWREGWERNRESSMDPRSPHGPLSFTSTALLRLAYIRINIEAGSIRSLGTWDPSRIAVSLNQRPPIQRSDRMSRAALHCAHALSIPIKLGINFVAHTQVFYWSIQHAICSLECALLLSKWLESVSVIDPQPPLNNEEQRVLRFVVQMITETEFYQPSERLFENNKRMSAIVVRLWAKLFRPDSVWEMVDLVGKSLRMYADLLESENEP